MTKEQFKLLDAKLQNAYSIPQFIHDLKYTLPHTNDLTVTMQWGSPFDRRSGVIGSKQLYDFLTNAIQSINNSHEKEKWNQASKLISEIDKIQSKLDGINIMLDSNSWTTNLTSSLKGEKIILTAQLVSLNQQFEKL